MGVTYTVEYICIDGTTLSVTLYKDSRLFNNNGKRKEKKEKKEKKKQRKKKKKKKVCYEF